MKDHFESSRETGERENTHPEKQAPALKEEDLKAVRESREAVELEDTVFEAIDYLKERQPNLDFSMLYAKLCPDDALQSDPDLMSRFLDFAWDLDSFTENGVGEMNQLLSSNKTEALINRMDKNLRIVGHLNREIHAPDHIISMAQDAARDLQEIQLDIRTLGRTEMGILSINGEFKTSWKVGELEVSIKKSAKSELKDEDLEDLQRDVQVLLENVGGNPPLNSEEIDAVKKLVQVHIDASERGFTSVRENWLENENDFLAGRLESFNLTGGQTEFLSEGEREKLQNMGDEEAQDFFTNTYLPRVANEHPDLIRQMVTSG